MLLCRRRQYDAGKRIKVVHLHLAVRDLPYAIAPFEFIEIGRTYGLGLTIRGRTNAVNVTQAGRAVITFKGNDEVRGEVAGCKPSSPQNSAPVDPINMDDIPF